MKNEINQEQEFYSINFNSNNVELYVEVVGEYDGLKLKTGEFSPEKLKVKKSQGRKAYDIVRLQDVFNFLISEKLRLMLIDANLTGWKTYKIESGKLLNGYEGFQCVGKCEIDIEKKTNGFSVKDSMKLETWDGNDFFILESTMMIICTTRAMEVIENLKIKNIELKNVKDRMWN